MHQLEHEIERGFYRYSSDQDSKEEDTQKEEDSQEVRDSDASPTACHTAAPSGYGYGYGYGYGNDTKDGSFLCRH